MSASIQVIIVGAGPVGLFLSCELALAGIAVLVLEKDLDPVSIWKKQPLGRRGLQPSSLEAFYRRDLLNAITPPTDERGLDFMRDIVSTYCGHFAGILLRRDHLDSSKYPYHLPGPAYAPLIMSLENLDTALSKRAIQLGVRIERGTEISAIKENAESVTVTISTGASFEADWLVGCDGGRSFTRKAAGIAFEGTGPEFVGYNVIAELDKPEVVKFGMHQTPNGLSVHPTKDNYSIIDFDLSFDRSKPVTREHFESVLQSHTKSDVKVLKLVAASTYTAACAQATQYRKGRVLLAGDAAHIHSPLGGQGLNAGIGDANNLAWKLAATVKGHAVEGLLDTYHDERFPVGFQVLEWTRAQVGAMRPDGCSKAVQRVIRGLADTTDGTTWLVGKIWGIETRYEFPGMETHDLVGRSAPDVTFKDGQRLGEKLQKVGHCFCLVDLEADDKVEALVKEIKTGDQVRYVAGQAETTFDLKCMIIRPDGFVCHVVKKEEDINLEAMRGALRQWVKVAA